MDALFVGVTVFASPFVPQVFTFCDRHIIDHAFNRLLNGR